MWPGYQSDNREIWSNYQSDYILINISSSYNLEWNFDMAAQWGLTIGQ